MYKVIIVTELLFYEKEESEKILLYFLRLKL